MRSSDDDSLTHSLVVDCSRWSITDALMAMLCVAAQSIVLNEQAVAAPTCSECPAIKGSNAQPQTNHAVWQRLRHGFDVTGCRIGFCQTGREM